MSFADLLPPLAEVLNAREDRAARRISLAENGTVLAATLRLPHALRLAYPDFLDEASAGIEAVGFRPAGEINGADGRALFFLSDEPVIEAKKKALALEAASPIGRFLDLDVNNSAGAVSRTDLGQPPRTCVVCDAPAWECIRAGRHSVDHVAATLEAVRFPKTETPADAIARSAQIAAEEELRLLYKPGLVTPITNGSHDDLNFPLMLESLSALSPWWKHCAQMGLMASAATPALLEALRPAGIEAEAAMMKVTNGANAYRGLIYLLGILCAATGVALSQGQPFSSVFDLSAVIAAEELHREPNTLTKAKSRGLHLLGARGEAHAGFPSVKGALSFLQNEKQVTNLRAEVLVNTLLFLMSGTEDTNVAGRGGEEGLHFLQTTSDLVLQHAGLVTDAGTELYRLLMRSTLHRRLSPGGSADLLIATLFLERLMPLFGENKA